MNQDQVNICWKQISISTKMACGARNATRTTTGNLRFQVESKPHRYIEISLNGLDLYEVEYYRLKRGTYEKVSIEGEADVYAENLSELIYHMVNR